MKAELAKANGLDHAVLYTEGDFATEVLNLTDGQGVDYAIDGIGGDTLMRTLTTVKPFGLVASIGQTAGTVAPIDPKVLTNRSLSRPSILALLADKTAYREASHVWFDMLGKTIKLDGGSTYPLTQAAQAHADMERRKTTGAVRLTVDHR
jgi:NADPH2:quinone reductase